MAEPRPVYLIRHGQTAWNLEKRLQGGKDSPLTALGERQAGAVAAALGAEPPGEIVASPLGRARRTAGIVANAFGLAPIDDARLGEMRFGEAEGLTLAEVDLRWPGFREERERRKWRTRWPGGESYEDVDARLAELCRDRLAALLDRTDEGPLAIVGHETTNKILLGRLLQLDPSAVTRLAQPNHVLYRVTGGLVDHACLGEGPAAWIPGMLRKGSDGVLHVIPGRTPPAIAERATPA